MPLAGATLAAYVTSRVPYDQQTLEHMKLQGHDDFTPAWSKKDNFARATYCETLRTDADGRCSVEFKQEGEVMILGHIPGYPTLRASVGWRGADADGGAVRISRTEWRTRLRLLFKGREIPGHSVTIGDLSVPDVQPAFVVKSDAESTVSTEWLDAGRRYWFIVDGPLIDLDGNQCRGVTEWQGQSEIELAALPRE
ncbi:MAG: hypothetical protein ACT4PV_13610 [Planctomycetaceae bacterium]